MDETKKNQTNAILDVIRQNIALCLDQAKSLDDDYEMKTVKNALSKALKELEGHKEKLNG